MSIKSDLVCPICKEIFDNPIFFPCHCSFCKGHVEEILKNKEDTLKCPICKEETTLPKQFKENTRIKMIIEKDGHLSEDEKLIKKSIEEIPVEYERIVNEIETKEKEFELIRFDHFADLRRSIDLRRENLKLSIDKIADELIDEAKILEENYKKKIAENNKIKYDTEEIESENEELLKLFRNPNVLLSSLEKSKAKLELKVKDVREKLKKFQEFKDELKVYKFEKYYELDDNIFGRIKTNDKEDEPESEQQIVFITNGNNNLDPNDPYGYNLVLEYHDGYFAPNNNYAE